MQNPTIVFCCGMVNSGMLIQHWLLCEILKCRGGCVPLDEVAFRQLPHTAQHSAELPYCIRVSAWDPEWSSRLVSGEAVGFYSFCDLRDVIEPMPPKPDVVRGDVFQAKSFQSLIADGECWLNSPNVYSTKYEFMVHDTRRIINEMAQWIGLRLKENEVLAITESFALSFAGDKTDSDSEPGHTEEFQSCFESSAPPKRFRFGLWRINPRPNQIEKIELEYKDWLETRGYLEPSYVQSKLDNSGEIDFFVPHLGWFSAPPCDEVARLLMEGHYEADLQAFLWLYLRDGDSFIDIGSHFGFYSKLAGKILPVSATIIAVEPNPINIHHLTANLRECGNVQIAECALGNRLGVSELDAEKIGLSSNSHLTSEKGPGTVTVNVSTVDLLLKEHKLSVASVVKIDTEGWEFDVLLGSGTSIAKNSLPVLIVEFAEKNLLHRGRTTRQLARHLQAAGYKLCKFSKNERQLLPVSNDMWPAWYENLFAVHDIEGVNARLTGAAPDRKRIASDILMRESVNWKVKDLENLEHYKNQAALSKDLESWAQRTETLLASERARCVELERWAHKSDKQSEDHLKLANENRAWAEAAERRCTEMHAQLLILQKRISDEEITSLRNGQWAQNAESRIQVECNRANASEDNARIANLELEKAHRVVIESNAKTASLESIVAGLNQQILFIDEKVNQLQTVNVEHLYKIEKTEKLLATEKERSAALEQSAHIAREESAQHCKLGEDYRRHAEAATEKVARIGVELKSLTNKLASVERSLASEKVGRRKLVCLNDEQEQTYIKFAEELRLRSVFKWSRRGDLSFGRVLTYLGAKSQVEICVIVCTFNPDIEIFRTMLMSLRCQTLAAYRWDLVVVDNNSSPPLDEGIVHRLFADRARVIREPRAGLSNARVCGFKETASNLIVCVDDDNFLDVNYLENALRIAKGHPSIGSWGGKSVPFFEDPPGGWTANFIDHLAVRDYGDTPITSNKNEWGKWDPVGAGMVVRKPVADAFISFLAESDNSAMFGRTGSLLIGGEDTLINRLANRIGYACSYQPCLELKHYIKPNRLTRRYFKKLLFAQGMTYVRLQRALGKKLPAIDSDSRQWLRKMWNERNQELGKVDGPLQWHWDLGMAHELLISRSASKE